jgi:hypothetical protein
MFRDSVFRRAGFSGFLALLAAPLAYAQARPAAPEEFGNKCCNFLAVPAAAFSTMTSGITYFNTGGYLYSPSDTGELFWAPVTLPTGVLIKSLGIYYGDSNGSGNVTATLRRYKGFDEAGATTEDIMSVSSAGSSGREFTAVPLSHTVNNSGILGGGQYAVVVNIPVVSGASLSFKAVEIGWQRQVSPVGLGAPHFGDVSPAHPYYQHIEALVASGITAGCGGGNYCPSAFITRGEMAVFLAKGLGLQWEPIELPE